MKRRENTGDNSYGRMKQWLKNKSYVFPGEVTARIQEIADQINRDFEEEVHLIYFAREVSLCVTLPKELRFL